jgi:hypothetical protein
LRLPAFLTQHVVSGMRWFTECEEYSVVAQDCYPPRFFEWAERLSKVLNPVDPLDMGTVGQFLLNFWAIVLSLDATVDSRNAPSAFETLNWPQTQARYPDAIDPPERWKFAQRSIRSRAH